MHKLSVVVLAILVTLTNMAFAAKRVVLHGAIPSELKAQSSAKRRTPPNFRLISRKTNTKIGLRTERYQQYYHGIPIMGGEVLVHSPVYDSHKRAIQKASPSWANGQVLTDIKLSLEAIAHTESTLNLKHALSVAKTDFTKNHHGHYTYSHEQARLVIDLVRGKATELVEVSFYATSKQQLPVMWFSYVTTTKKPIVIKSWNQIPHYEDTGPGGNVVTGKYIYGEQGLPALQVSQDGDFCVLDDDHVRVVNLNGHNEQNALGDTPYDEPYRYICGSAERDEVNGAFSPSNDAWFFSHVTKSLYEEWYGLPPIVGKNEQPLKIIVKVHRHPPCPSWEKDCDAESPWFDNAFWNPLMKTLHVGDGSPDGFYPLTTLDVIAHEIGHGFTQTQGGYMAYHDQSGSLNESFSDMSAMAANAYLLEEMPKMYRRIYGTYHMNWAMGRTIVRDGANRVALRFMEDPELDHHSPGCLLPVAGCFRTFEQMVNEAKGKQNRIVHYGSGIFNKAFYILATSPHWTVQKAFLVMLVANQHFWTRGAAFQTTYFQQAACGVRRAAMHLYQEGLLPDVGNPKLAVTGAFEKVGIDLSLCQAQQ